MPPHMKDSILKAYSLIDNNAMKVYIVHVTAAHCKETYAYENYHLKYCRILIFRHTYK